MPRRTAAAVLRSRRLRLVFEIGVEELPVAAAWAGAYQLREGAGPALRAARIPAGDITAYSTPRRIVLIVEDVAPRQDDLVREVRGPAARVAFGADGRPTQAAEGFARAQGASPEQLVRRTTPQGEYVYALTRAPGTSTIEALRDTLPALASGLVFPKAMRWGSESVRFARPVRWVLALLGRDIVPFEFAGVRSGRTTYGHRLLSAGPVRVADARAFEGTLKKHRVLLDPELRRRRISSAAIRAAQRAGGRPILDAALLEESVQLLEWPEALAGTFAEEFLALPREVLITVMQHHQKYFAVEGAAGQLLPAFVALRNGGTRGLRTVREGNEWVLRARLADARFFFQEDRKRPLESRIPELAGLVVHEKLGTVEEKTHRMARLAARLGSVLRLDQRQAAQLHRAALLSKADLVTHIVRELPELQGIVGGIYARLDGEPAPVAEALGEQYLPRGTDLPRSDIGASLALIDKLDTLLSALAAGLAVSGSQDPYGLRRAAHGVVAIVLDRHLRANVRDLAAGALDESHRSLDPEARTAALDAMMDLLRQRLRTALIDAGISYDTVDAALEAGCDDLEDAAVRARALWTFRRHPEFLRLYTAFDRARRILPPQFEGRLRPDALEEPAEQRLLRSLEEVRPRVLEARTKGRYDETFAYLAALAGPVDQFFTDVLVMADDETARTNRLALLAGVVGLVRPIADLSRVVVVGEGKASGNS
ncbi:MAG TPA: glycine--tRNA ligase subunit beta [bacterium]|nr:glycine--tRNA ligase subunit beta [bacterium]